VDLRENPCSWTLAKLFVRALFTTHFCSLKQAHNFSQQCFVTVGNCLGQSHIETAQKAADSDQMKIAVSRACTTATVAKITPHTRSRLL